MAEEDGYRHVLVVPWVAESHVNGMLHFALLLASLPHHQQQGLLISFGYPARAHAFALKRNKLSSLPTSLRVHVIEDGLPTSEHESPTIAHIRGSLALIQNGIEALLKQYNGLDAQSLGHVEDVDGVRDIGSFTEALDGVMDKRSSFEAVDGVKENWSSTGLDMVPSSWPSICCIISDTFLPLMQDVTDKLGIPRVDFWTASATCYYMVLYLPEILARGLLPLPEGVGEKWRVDAPLIDFVPGVPHFPLTELPRELLQTTDVSHPRYQFMLDAFGHAKDADRILVHSFYELESHVYDAMQAQGFAIYPVGPLFEDRSDSAAGQYQCLEWLDKQKPDSVVYLAFGTVAKLNLQEMHSMALGLEASNYHFLWVIRMDSLPTTSLQESLPEGFMEKTVSQGKGFIATWTPQMEVLKHTAVGVFVSHCGWSSTLESLWAGVPMVTCPRAAEQRCNAKLIVQDWRVGMEMEREDDGTFTKEAVQRAIEEVMGNQEMKERALHFKQAARHTIAQGKSYSNVISFVDHLLHLPVPRRR